MRMKVRLTFVEPWSSIIAEVAKQCNMTVDEYCRRAVQVLTKQGLDEGERDGQSRSNDPAGNAIEVRAGDATDSNALANPPHPELQASP